MTLASRAQAALIRRQKQAGGLAVTYTRGAQSVSLTAWLGRTQFARLGGPGAQGAAVEWGDRDYLFATADLRLGEPEVGDRLTEAGSGLVYEVCTPDTGEPGWRYSDPSRTVIRVHTRRVVE